VKRRTFLIAGLSAGAAGAGLLVGVGRIVAGRVGDPEDLAPAPGTVALNGWVRIGKDGTVTMVLAPIEMGQGVSTALPMILADELDVPLSRVHTEPPGPQRRYGNREVFAASSWFHPDNENSWLARQVRAVGLDSGAVLGVQVTGGSTSVRDSYETLRIAGASARALLVAAAAGRWGVPVAECRTADGFVVHRNGRLAYGALAEEAARLPVNGDVVPKSAAQRALVGTNAPRRDIPAKVTGAAIYGADLRLPGMLFAAVRSCPVPGASLKSFDAAAADAMIGVVKVFSFEGAAGCAPGIIAVARNSWQAQLAASACKVEWTEAPNGSADTGPILAGMRAMLDGEQGGVVFHERGDGAAVLERSARVIRADYSAPWLAHATMEPMNCTAQWVTDGTSVGAGGGTNGGANGAVNGRVIDSNGAPARLKLWVPTQVPTFALDTAARVSGLAREQIDIIVTEIGCGFGRRLETDYLVPAIHAARAMAPAPVQVQWSREEDMTHDFYRPAALCRLQASLGAGGRPTGWVTRSLSDAITPQSLGRNLPLMGKMSGLLPDRTQAEGLWDQAYEIPNRRCTHVTFETPVPIGYWRSVGHSHMAFFAESFLDELAHAAETDPFEYRRALLANHPRYRAVLELAAQKAGWGGPLPAGRARGIALHESFDTIVAQVAEVSLDAGRPRVHRVVCAVDCGTVIHPGIVAQQVEGSVIFALSACLYGSITFRNGRVEQKNFPDYDMVRLRDAPAIETWIVPSEAPPTGMGEPAVPPLAAAVGNALFMLSGQRLRDLPFRLA
jgi:isoquinoline 1-oxidoreductase beta subunit